MKRYAFIDLHIHTVHSYEDGVDITVQRLLDTLNAMAEKEDNDICFSITDHESILGCIEADKILKSDPIRYRRLKFIPGIELNASLKSVGLNSLGRSIYSKCHMLGYDYDLTDKNLIAYSKIVHKKTYGTKIKRHRTTKIQINTGRQLICAKKYLETIFKTKIPFSVYDDCANLKTHEEIRNKFLEITSEYLNVSPKEISALIEEIFFKKSFNNDIAEGNSKQDIFDIIDMIKSAGGKVGIAHGNTIQFEKQEMFVYAKQNKTKMEMLDRFIDIVQKSSNNGLDFVEIFHNENTIPRAFDKMFEIAEKYNLYITCGSDFHGGTLHPNNMLSKCFSKRFEYCSLEGEKREINKFKIKNKITELAFVEHTFNKNNEKITKNKRAFRCENIEKGSLNLLQIKSIIDSIDLMNTSEFKRFYRIPKDENKINKKRQSKKKIKTKKSIKSRIKNNINVSSSTQQQNDVNKPPKTYKFNNNNSRYTKKDNSKNNVLQKKIKIKKVHKNKYSQFSKVDKVEKEEEKSL